MVMVDGFCRAFSKFLDPVPSLDRRHELISACLEPGIETADNLINSTPPVMVTGGFFMTKPVT